MSYLDALKVELADCEKLKKTARIAAIKAEIARAEGKTGKVENASAAPAVETAAATKRKGASA